MNDRFSTPARRRRIIADVAKFLLRQYCVKACNNVHRRRVENAAAVVLQCAVRLFLSKRLLLKLRLSLCQRACTTIQSLWRQAIARHLLFELKREFRSKAMRKFARFTQRAWREYQRKLRLRHLTAERRRQKEMRRARAAVILQKVVRGLLARRRVGLMRLARLEKDSKSRGAATMLQCLARQRMSRRTVHRLRIEKQAAGWVCTGMLKFWRRLKARKKMAAVALLQRWIRGCLARFLFWKLRQNYNTVREVVREVIDSLDPGLFEPLPAISPPATEEVCSETVEVITNILESVITEIEISAQRDPPVARVCCDVVLDAPLPLLAHIAGVGPLAAVLVAQAFYLVSYDSSDGYSLGSVARQLEACTLLSKSTTGCTKTDIVVEEWNTDHRHDDLNSRGSHGMLPPAAGCCPSRWNQVLDVGNKGASIEVNYRQSSIELRLEIPYCNATESKANSGFETVIGLMSGTTSVSGQDDFRIQSGLYTFVLRCPSSDGSLHVVAPAKGRIYDGVDFVSFFEADEKPALLQKQPRTVSSKSELKTTDQRMLTSSTGIERKFPFDKVDVIWRCELLSGSGDYSFADQLESMQYCVRLQDSAPFQAAPKDSICYDVFASKIQRASAKFLDVKSAKRLGASRAIAKCWKRLKRKKLWRKALQDLRSWRVSAAIVIQCCVRQSQSRCLLSRLRRADLLKEKEAQRQRRIAEEIARRNSRPFREDEVLNWWDAGLARDQHPSQLLEPFLEVSLKSPLRAEDFSGWEVLGFQVNNNPTQPLLANQGNSESIFHQNWFGELLKIGEINLPADSKCCISPSAVLLAVPEADLEAHRLHPSKSLSLRKAASKLTRRPPGERRCRLSRERETLSDTNCIEAAAVNVNADLINLTYTKEETEDHCVSGEAVVQTIPNGSDLDMTDSSLAFRSEAATEIVSGINSAEISKADSIEVPPEPLTAGTGDTAQCDSQLQSGFGNLSLRYLAPESSEWKALLELSDHSQQLHMQHCSKKPTEESGDRAELNEQEYWPMGFRFAHIHMRIESTFD